MTSPDRVDLRVLRALVATSEEILGMEIVARAKLGGAIYVRLTQMELAGLVSSRRTCACDDACDFADFTVDHRRRYRVTEAGRAALAEVDGVETYRGPR